MAPLRLKLDARLSPDDGPDVTLFLIPAKNSGIEGQLSVVIPKTDDQFKLGQVIELTVG